MQAGLRRRRAGGRAAAEDSSDEEGNALEGQEGAPLSKTDAYEAKRAARDAERDAQEAAQDAEIRRAAEERAAREEAEAAKWMHTFTVEAAGEQAESAEQGEAALERMAAYLRRRKTVALEELAAEFGVRTAEAVARVRALEADGRITGVMDDRGKYIYVSREEMAAAAEFIRRRGRVAIAELAASSADFIDLEAKEERGGEALVLELLEAA